MKYIRTKDGRIIDCVKLVGDAKKHILQNENDYKLAHVLSSKTYDTNFGWQRRVIKQADDIKELCDCFLLVDKNERDGEVEDPLATKDYQRLLAEFRVRLVDGSDIRKMAFYGCIWAFGDDGLPRLEPVAKLVKREWWELELL